MLWKQTALAEVAPWVREVVARVGSGADIRKWLDVDKRTMTEWGAALAAEKFIEEPVSREVSNGARRGAIAALKSN